ncbi:MAG: hypothetical protein ACTTJ6_00065 [Treponema sp.]
MNQDQVKNILLQIEDTSLDFSLIFSGKESRKVNGLYKPNEREIILHNKNFANDNEMIYTAIHEYTHHKQCELKGLPRSSRQHTNDFWAMFHRLLSIAEEKGFYKIGLEEGSELEEITKRIRSVLMVEDGRIMKELGELLGKARKLCKEAHVRYEDYIDRVLKLPRSTATSMERMYAFDVDPSIGYDAMKKVASISNIEKRKQAEALYIADNSPAVVKTSLNKKKEENEKTLLEKERLRLERTIDMMKVRLEEVKTRLTELE